jgi:hypothetical protein
MQDMEADTPASTPAQDNTASGQADAQSQAQAAAAPGNPAPAADAQAATPADANAPKGETPASQETAADKSAEGKEPDAPAKVELKYPEGFKPDNLTKWFLETAGKVGLSSEQAQAVFDGWESMRTQAQAAVAKQTEEASTLLQAEWQKDYEPNLKLAAKTMRQLGGQELADYLDKTGLGNSPELVRAFHRAGKLLSEDVFINGGSGVGNQERAPGGLPMLGFPSMDKK